MMKDIIKLSSRGYYENHLKRLSKTDRKESKTYLLKSDGLVRTGNTENGQKFIDPSGGPMIIVGELLQDVGLVVKSIDFISGLGYTITFK